MTIIYKNLADRIRVAVEISMVGEKGAKLDWPILTCRGGAEEKQWARNVKALKR